MYEGSHEEVSIDVMDRKRNVVIERRISPTNFSSTHKASSRHDDKVRASSLNQYNAKQIAAML